MKILRILPLLFLLTALRADTGTPGVTKAQMNAALLLKADARAVGALGSNALALTSNKGIYAVKTVTWATDQTLTYTGGSSLAGAGQVIVANVTTAMNLTVTATTSTVYRNGSGTALAAAIPVPIGIHTFRFWTPNTGSTLYLDDTVFTEGDIPLNRQTFSNANVTISAGVTVVEQTGTMSASRTATLAAASSYRAGQRVFILDVSGTVTTTNTLVVARAGSDTINGASTSLILDGAYCSLVLESDGTSKWTIVASTGRTWNETNLTDGATITQTMIPGLRQQNAKATLGGNRTLAFSGLAAGMEGNLRVVQDGTGSRTLALPANSRVNGSATTVTLLTAAAAENILSWYTPDGTNIRWTNGTY